MISQLRAQVPQSSPALTAAAVAAGGWLSSIRFFSSEGSQRLYVGNLSFEATQEDVEQAFEKFGPVHVSLQQSAGSGTRAVSCAVQLYNACT